MSAPQIPQKAPISIIPSSPMFTTPERSENMPPIAPKVSGVAKTSIEAIRLAVKTWSRLPTLDLVARSASAIPSTPVATAPHPTRPAPRLSEITPKRIARIPTSSDQVRLREVIGGIASRNAMTPSRIPNEPTEAASSRRERSTRSTPPA